jgi:hypothetical protein
MNLPITIVLLSLMFSFAQAGVSGVAELCNGGMQSRAATTPSIVRQPIY